MYLFLLSPYNVAAADKPDSIRRAGKYQSTFDTVINGCDHRHVIGV